MYRSFFLILPIFLFQYASAQIQFERGKFDASGVEISYIVAGEGEAVVLVHGFTGSTDSWLRSGQFESLAENYRVVAFDARGHGQSGKPTEASSYGKEMGRDIVRLIDHLDIPAAHLVGYSMGSRLISVAITENESRFKSVVFGGRVPTWVWRQSDEQTVQQRYQLLTENPPRQLVETGASPTALATVQIALENMTIPIEKFKRLQIPMLAILGGEDPRLESARDFVSQVPSVELIVVEGEDHSSTLSHPLFLGSVLNFLSETSGQ